jgi:DNA-binding CsgD family transcriptional regulator
VNTYRIRILGYHIPQAETFRYWFLSHFAHLSSVEVIYLNEKSIITPEYSGLSILLLFNQSDITHATLLYKRCIDQPIIIYHNSIKEECISMKGEKYPLHECMKYLERKFIASYEDNQEKEVLFTKREKEVLELFAQGMSVKEVAYNLQISPYTVATHQRSLYLKTKSHSLQQLTLFASMEYKREGN